MISGAIQEYCASEHFIFLDASLKEYAESLLGYWCEKVGDDISDDRIESATHQVALLDVPVPVRRAFPQLLTAFCEYLADSGQYPGARDWIGVISRSEPKYVASLRDDGTVRGETFEKGYPDVGRNAPCPCGSGKKYKKCCYGMFS